MRRHLHDRIKSGTVRTGRYPTLKMPLHFLNPRPTCTALRAGFTVLRTVYTIRDAFPYRWGQATRRTLHLQCTRPILTGYCVKRRRGETEI